MRKLPASLTLLTAMVVFVSTTPTRSYEIDHPYFSTEQAKAFADFVAQSQQKLGDLDRQIQATKSEASSAQSEVSAAQAELSRVLGAGSSGWLDNLGMIAHMTGFSAIVSFLKASFLIFQILSFAGFLAYLFYLRRYNRQKWQLLTSGRKLAEFWTSRKNRTLSILIVAGGMSLGWVMPASAQVGIFQQIEWRYFGTEVQRGYISLQYGPERPLSYKTLGAIPLYGAPYTRGSWYREFDRLAHVALLHLPLTAENLKPLFAFGNVAAELDHLYALIANIEPRQRSEMMIWRMRAIRRSATSTKQAIPELVQISSVLRAARANNLAEDDAVRAELADTLDAFAQSKTSGQNASTEDIFQLAKIYSVISADKARDLLLSRRTDVDYICDSHPAALVFKELAGNDQKVTTGTLYDKNELYLLFAGKDISKLLRCVSSYAPISDPQAAKIASVINVSQFRFSWNATDREFVAVINRYRPEETGAVYHLLVEQAASSLRADSIATALDLAPELGQKVEIAAVDILGAFLKTTSFSVSDGAALTQLFDATRLSDRGLILQVAGRAPQLSEDFLVYLQNKSSDLFYAYLNQIAKKDPGLLARLRLPYPLIDLHQLKGYVDDDALKEFSSVPAYYFLLDHELREAKIEPSGLLLELEGMVEMAFMPPGKEKTPAGFIDAFLTDDFLRRAATLAGAPTASGADGRPSVPAAIAEAFRHDATILDRFVALTLDDMAEDRHAKLNAQIAERERDLVFWRSRTQTLRSQVSDIKAQVSNIRTEQILTQIKPTLTIIMMVVNFIATIIAICLSLNYALNVILACEHSKFLLIMAVFVECFCFFLLCQLNFPALVPLLMAQLLAILARVQWPSTEVLYAAYSSRVLGRPTLREVA